MHKWNQVQILLPKILTLCTTARNSTPHRRSRLPCCLSLRSLIPTLQSFTEARDFQCFVWAVRSYSTVQDGPELTATLTRSFFRRVRVTGRSNHTQFFTLLPHRERESKRKRERKRESERELITPNGPVLGMKCSAPVAGEV